MTGNQYTPAQVAAVTRLSLAAVHKAIDSRLVKPRMARTGKARRRLLTKEQIIYLQLEVEGVRLLPLRVRRKVAQTVERLPQVEEFPIGNGDVLRVEVKSARRKVEAELGRLANAERIVVSDPEIMRGTQVYRGTRIPVHLVADMLAQGASVEEILEGYPSLDRDKVELTSVYVRAFPRRGRPARRPWAGQKPLRVTRRRLRSHTRNDQ